MGTMKIAVLGLGHSLSLFNNEYDLKYTFDYTIGVNDIWRSVETQAVVCLDHRRVFNADRLIFIDNCKPEIFYSQIVNYDTRPDFKLIKLFPYFPDSTCNLDSECINKSLCSPFVACGVAYKYHNAKEIHVFGVDLIGHPHLDAGMCQKIKLHFRNLKIALQSKGCDLIIHGLGILKDI
jgi:hypothetical protein